MSHEQTGQAWSTGFATHHADPERLNDLAVWCEEQGTENQRLGFERVLREMTEAEGEAEGARRATALQWISLLADSGAFESAAVAMIPRGAIFTGGRLQDGSFVAQVILAGGSGAHSRAAHSLSMAWLAALLRALARQSIENRAVGSKASAAN
jgi:hypothetical protein